MRVILRGCREDLDEILLVTVRVEEGAWSDDYLRLREDEGHEKDKYVQSKDKDVLEPPRAHCYQSARVFVDGNAKSGSRQCMTSTY